MAALAWLIIPFIAAVAAGLWGRWAGRRRATGDGASLAGYERFRVAMEAPEAADAPDPKAGAGSVAAVTDAAGAVGDGAGTDGRAEAPQEVGALVAEVAAPPQDTGGDPARDGRENAWRRRRTARSAAGATAAPERPKGLGAALGEAGEEESPRSPVVGPVP